MPKDTVLNTLSTGIKHYATTTDLITRNPNRRQYPFKDKYNVIHQNPTCCAPALPNLTKSITKCKRRNVDYAGTTAKVESWIST